jgi:hypothetical protein
MKRARIGIIAAAIVAVASVAFAQKPDFSGTWTIDPEASGMAAGGAAGAGGGAGGGGARGMGGGGPVTIKQTEDTLTIERTMGENKVVTTYNLAGKEQENARPGRGGGAATTAKYTSKWDGSKLVTTIVAEGANGPQTSTESRWIEGATMVVETASTGRDGNPQTRKQVWKKTT